MELENIVERTGKPFFIRKPRHFAFFVAIAAVIILISASGCRSIPNASNRSPISEAREDTSRIVARINGEPLTYDALKRQYDLYVTMMGQSAEDYEGGSLEAYLDRYILEMLLLQEARRENIRLTPNEMAAEKESYLKQMNLTQEALSDKLSRAHLTMADAERFLENNWIIDQWSRKKFKDISVSDEEVRAFYDSNPKYFQLPESISLSRILICHEETPSCKSGLTKQAAKALAERVRKMATPENFAALARQYSTDETASKGGRLGTFFKGVYGSNFEEGVFSMDIGEISEVEDTPSGFRILLVTDKQKAGVTPFETVQDAIRENLKTSHLQSAILNYSLKLKDAAKIQTFAFNEKAVASGSPFQTFSKTDYGRCTDDKGLPVIIMYSVSSCPHCQWVGGVFDAVVQEYVDKGLIEAHHYDMETEDDLLTQTVETKIPEKYMAIGKRGDPKGSLPYFNFGCQYERIGTGYEAQDDLNAEADEMRRVIEALVHPKKTEEVK